MNLNNKRLGREQSAESAPDEGIGKLMSMTTRRLHGPGLVGRHANRGRRPLEVRSVEMGVFKPGEELRADLTSFTFLIAQSTQNFRFGSYSSRKLRRFSTDRAMTKSVTRHRRIPWCASEIRPRLTACRLLVRSGCDPTRGKCVQTPWRQKCLRCWTLASILWRQKCPPNRSTSIKNT